MLEARKENKVYQITDQQKDRYLKEGFDIYEDGQLVMHTPKKVIKYSDHLLYVKKVTVEKNTEIELLKAELEAKEAVADSVLELLKNYANIKGIDIGSASSETGILNKILEVEKV